jgi:hypothetical protein
VALLARGVLAALAAGLLAIFQLLIRELLRRDMQAVRSSLVTQQAVAAQGLLALIHQVAQRAMVAMVLVQALQALQ